MEPDTTTQPPPPPPPPPYYLPGQTPVVPNLPNQQQPDSIVIVQDPNYQPEECCTCFCTIKWILIVLLAIILLPIVLVITIIAIMFCPDLANKKVEHGNERNMESVRHA